MNGWRALDGVLIFTGGVLAGVVLVVVAIRTRPVPAAPED